MKTFLSVLAISATVVMSACSSKPLEPTEAEMQGAMQQAANQDPFGPKKVTYFKKSSCQESVSANKDHPNYVCSFEVGVSGYDPRQSIKTFFKNSKGEWALM